MDWRIFWHPGFWLESFNTQDQSLPKSAVGRPHNYNTTAPPCQPISHGAPHGEKRRITSLDILSERCYNVINLTGWDFFIYYLPLTCQGFLLYWFGAHLIRCLVGLSFPHHSHTIPTPFEHHTPENLNHSPTERMRIEHHLNHLKWLAWW